ncbi:MAG: glucose-6-phosphate dehydrogenase, partial [Ginsengibacter sp.]
MLDYKKLPSTVIFIFGGSGDLNYRKLNPALFNLFLDNAMPEHFSIVGIARKDYSDADYKKHLKEGLDNFSRIKDSDGKWKEFSKNISYLKMDINDAASYDKIAQIAKEKEKQAGTRPTVVFYMAVAPQLVPEIIKHIGNMEICKDTKCSRVVVEKPFGHDLKSAIEMNQMLSKYFEEDQIYRIDHYLGKETVQNILALRFANALFE